MAPRHDNIRRARPLLGTFVEIYAAGSAAPKLEAAVEKAFCAIARVHRLMSFHESDSDVSRLNRHASMKAMEVDSWTWWVLDFALELHRRSDGIFDIATAPIMQKHDLLPTVPASLGLEMCPPNPVFSPPVRHCGDGRDAAILLLPGSRVRFRSASTVIDLGGIAKGFAVDRAIDTLREQGVVAGIVNAGGDISAFGPEHHSVHIRDPRNSARVLCEIGLENEALATSGLRVDPASNQICDPAIVNPRTNTLCTALAGASVLASSCMTADALTKVVMIAGANALGLLDCYHASALTISNEGDVNYTSGLRGALRAA